MSFDLSVHLPKERLPTPAKWQAAISAKGFPLKLAADFDLTTLHGWLPCEYQGKPGGFECHHSIRSQEELQEMEIPESFPCEILFSTRARVKEEFLSEMIAAAVLAEMTGGVLVEPQSDGRFEGKKAVEWARAQVAMSGGRGVVVSARSKQPSVSHPGPVKLFLGGLFFTGVGVAMFLMEASPVLRVVATAAVLFGLLGFVAFGIAIRDANKKP
ncbi:hypothetical protein [Prosthecobacter sp.]|uniref:hypothetical protein n=1 Tax=Prosthecobacter sp. TaxID=1965333 RepID=UPI003782D623